MTDTARHSAPQGTEDHLPARVQLVHWLQATCRHELERYGYQEIRTPLFEDTRLFERALGAATDVVEREMFTCEHGDQRITFRPEGTAGIARAFLEHKLAKIRPFQKFYYIGPMFRFERPRQSRQRQFDQIGVEAIGSRDPRLDAEVIHLAARVLDALGLTGHRVYLHTLGNAGDRARYRTALQDFARPRLEELCDHCQARFEANVLQLLDCKNGTCRTLLSDAPALLNDADRSTKRHFDEVQNALGALGRDFVVDRHLVRGFDYYTGTVFEIRRPTIDTDDTLAGGGRYDTLLEELGGPPMPAIGFSIGVPGVLLALQSAGIADEHTGEKPCTVFLVATGDAERLSALVLAEELRQAGLVVDLDYESKTIQAQLRSAAKRSARVVLVLGEQERARGVIQVQDVRSGKLEDLPMDGDLQLEIKRILASQDEAGRA